MSMSQSTPIPSLNYTPPPTLARLMLDNTSLVRCAVGPVGSGKSMSMIAELLRRSRQQNAHNGVRRSRWALIRNTLAQLKATVLVDVLQYLGPLASFHVTDSTVKVRAMLADGTRIESDWLLVPLDRPEDQQRLLSLQLTGAWVNEAREVPIDILMALIGRCGRFPSKLMGGASWYGVLLDTNPWSTASDYHETFVLAPTPGWTLYKQPGGRAVDAENVANLPVGYYDNLANGRDPEWARVHVDGEWGDDLSGQAVFRRSFDVGKHVVDLDEITLSMTATLMVCLDFGRTPAALITHVDHRGVWWILDEITTEDVGLRQMLRERLKPKLFSPEFGGRRMFIIADPAGREKSQLSEENAFDVLAEEGFMAYPAPTNAIDKRLLAVEKVLMGRDGVKIVRGRCPVLVRALSSEYKYKRKKTGDLDDLPEKSHPWSDICDAMQYGAMGVNANYAAIELRRSAREAHSWVAQRPRVGAGAWT